MTAVLVAEAPAKLNLCLYVGARRGDGFHELVSLFESISLTDVLRLRKLGDSEQDDVVNCPGLVGENLVATALRLCRERGLLDGPGVEISIEKRIPVSAGLGGGSADAAAALRLVSVAYDRNLSEFEGLAFELGADVPSQLRPARSLVRGAGELVAPIDDRCFANSERSYLIVPQAIGLSTAEVFAQADRVGLSGESLGSSEAQLVDWLTEGISSADMPKLIKNDLEPAIVSLRPELNHLPDEIVELGAVAAGFTGTGPTCFGVFDNREQAEQARREFARRSIDALCADPAEAGVGQPYRDTATGEA